MRAPFLSPCRRGVSAAFAEYGSSPACAGFVPAGSGLVEIRDQRRGMVPARQGLQ